MFLHYPLTSMAHTCDSIHLVSSFFLSVVTCPREDLYVPYASFAVSSVTYSSTVTYRCAKGYNRTAGDLQRTCQQNERWSGSAPTCTSTSYVLLCCFVRHNYQTALLGIRGRLESLDPLGSLLICDQFPSVNHGSAIISDANITIIKMVLSMSGYWYF